MSTCNQIWPFIKCILLAALLFWSLGLYFYIKSLPNAKTDEQNERSRTHEQFQRLKRDFMFAPGHNQTTDSDCFQSCNDDWKAEFEREFKMNCTDFYDFPFHPKLLDEKGYRRYCELAKKQTTCFVEECQDESAVRVFSPSNFLCKFKKDEFLKARSCLEETEPLNFLKCDHQCHQQAMLLTKETKKRANLGKVFAEKELDHYESELSLLCTFQECYKQCHRQVVDQTCEPDEAKQTIDLVQSYVQWHATDVYDWHVLSENLDKMPDSCLRLTGYRPEDDPIMKIMSNLP
ncbi:hypothetical protein M3Y97_01152600 [Aphelenchoides bicaudatus]|nr:hypothetical protein M3Y97_01152600 [Aphelenchoides bicaudatus]